MPWLTQNPKGATDPKRSYTEVPRYIARKLSTVAEAEPSLGFRYEVSEPQLSQTTLDALADLKADGVTMTVLQ